MVTIKKISEQTDNELIAAYLRSQDTSFFTALYRRYANKVFAKSISMLNDEALARDATQDIFIKNSAVTVANGLKIPKGSSYEQALDAGAAIYAITASGSSDIRVAEYAA